MSCDRFVDDRNCLIIVTSLPFVYRKCPTLKTSTYMCTSRSDSTVPTRCVLPPGPNGRDSYVDDNSCLVVSSLPPLF
jgi:hypothetical protein